jgi:hypothetical protein
MTISSYDETYYENGIKTGISCYENYRWLDAPTINAAKAMLQYAEISQQLTMLDYGCAKGFYVHAFRILGMHCYGYDISSYAINNCKPEIRQYVSTNLNDLPLSYELIVAKDIFEHLEESQLPLMLDSLKTKTNKIFICVPLGENDKYLYDDDNKDITHKIIKPLDWWKTLISSKYVINKYTTRIAGLKDKQYHANFNSCGFFLCKTN